MTIQETVIFGQDDQEDHHSSPLIHYQRSKDNLKTLHVICAIKHLVRQENEELAKSLLKNLLDHIKQKHFFPLHPHSSYYFTSNTILMASNVVIRVNCFIKR